MTLFLDRHDAVTHAPEEVARLHACDLDAQAKFGVRYLTYWYQDGKPEAFCLVEAPTKEAAEAVHQAAHGNVAGHIIEVDKEDVEIFLGPIREPSRGEAWEDVSLRTILCTSLAGAATGSMQEPSRILREALDSRGGHEVRAGSESMLGRFGSVTGALECALAIQKSFAPLASVFQHTQVQVKTGIHAGEPVTHSLELFGDAVLIAAALSAKAAPGEILVSGAVRDLCAGEGYVFSERSEQMIPGFESPLRIYSVERNRQSWLDVPPLNVTGPPRPYPDGLSPREVEVLRLISMGRTNQEIADELVISLNTVATHVRNILDKTDSANRAEAACYALRRRLA